MEMGGRCELVIKVTLHLQKFDAKEKKLQKYDKFFFILKSHHIFQYC